VANHVLVFLPVVNFIWEVCYLILERKKLNSKEEYSEFRVFSCASVVKKLAPLELIRNVLSPSTTDLNEWKLYLSDDSFYQFMGREGLVGLVYHRFHQRMDEKILSRRKKGFSNPYMEYLIESKKINLIKEVNEQTGIFKREILEQHIQKASSGGFKQHIWGLYVLSVWIKKYLL